MNVLHPRCAGLDLAHDHVVAGIRVQKGGQVRQEWRKYPTTTKKLLELVDWLTSEGITHVVMEATGSYWRAVWHVLEGSFEEVVLANAQAVKAVPGRKSDVNDALWLADLLAHGLIRGSFVPPVPIQDLRELTRTRTQLVREKVQHTQRIQKTLDTANVKVATVMSSVVGLSGRDMLRAIINGETDPQVLAGLARGSLRRKHDQLVEALDGRLRAHHGVLLKMHLDMIETIERNVADLDRRIAQVVEPFREAVQHLRTIPGVSLIVALIIVAEVGVDLSRFPTSQHLISWAGLCPQLNITGGKPKSTRLRDGDKWLKTALVQAAWAAVRVKDSYLRAQYYRLRTRRGPKKAIVAVAASILTAVYHILRDNTVYREAGGDYFNRLEGKDQTQRLVRTLNRLGYEVSLRKAA